MADPAGWQQKFTVTSKAIAAAMPDGGASVFPCPLVMNSSHANWTANHAAFVNALTLDGDGVPTDLIVQTAGGVAVPWGLNRITQGASPELIVTCGWPALAMAGSSYKLFQGAAGAQNRAGVVPVGDGFRAYWPMEEPSGTVVDWTANAYHGSVVGSPTFGINGQIGAGINYAGTYHTCGDVLDALPTVTVNVWVNLDSILAGGTCPLGRNYGYRIVISNTGNVRFVVETTANAWYSPGTFADSTTNLTAGTWYLLTGVYDGSGVKVYINGALEGTGSRAVSGSITNKNYPFGIGADSGSGIYTDGNIDEPSVSLVRSANWMTAYYAMTAAPLTSWTLGAVQTPGGGGPIIGSSIIVPGERSGIVGSNIIVPRIGV